MDTLKLFKYCSFYFIYKIAINIFILAGIVNNLVMKECNSLLFKIRNLDM